VCNGAFFLRRGGDFTDAAAGFAAGVVAVGLSYLYPCYDDISMVLIISSIWQLFTKLLFVYKFDLFFVSFYLNLSSLKSLISFKSLVLDFRDVGFNIALLKGVFEILSEEKRETKAANPSAGIWSLWSVNMLW